MHNDPYTYFDSKMMASFFFFCEIWCGVGGGAVLKSWWTNLIFIPDGPA
jgi:hypothetical protein